MPDPLRPLLARSYLYAPGHVERFLQKIFDVGADAVILDLEDAVPPAEKRKAREMVAEVLRKREGMKGPQIYVRINSLAGDLWREELEAIVQPALYGIRVPKVESRESMIVLDGALRQAEERAGLAPGSVRVVPAVETAAGVLAAAEIVRNPRVVSLGLGGVDLLRDLSMEPDPSGLQLLYAQSYVVLVSRAAGLIPPVATVHPQVKDLEGLRATSLAAKRLGFFGRACIHPSQIAVIHEVFTPSPDQIARARAIVEAFHAAAARGSGAFLMEDGEFVDIPVAERAQALVNLAESLNRRSEN
ncbi:MAG TPA: CoA ester lyase [Candidatus Dormibacteraeota bacterium]|nr:CoA ester lyase [Candidatus Dormibacteraeota bacterium]